MEGWIHSYRGNSISEDNDVNKTVMCCIEKRLNNFLIAVKIGYKVLTIFRSDLV